MLTLPFYEKCIQTAYFVIPENVKHGEELICSYFACRNAGIKFRYCSQCKVPVAKRNFRKRHKHGGDPIAGGKGDDSGGDEDNVAVKKGIPSQITASREESADADGISSQSADSTNNHQDTKIKPAAFDGAQRGADLQQGLLVRNSMRTFESAKIKSKGASFENDAAQASPKTISGERKERWVALLAKRPSTKDSDTMSAWLMDVLAVSDLETPLQIGNSLATTEVDGRDMKEPDLHKHDKNGRGAATERKKRGGESLSSDVAYEDDSGNDSKGKNTADDNVDDHGVAAVTKKRSAAEVLGDEVGDTEKKSEYVSGSFAEWKERKKQRKQSKTSTPPPSTEKSPKPEERSV